MAPTSTTASPAAADERDRKRKRGAGGEAGAEAEAQAERTPKWRTRREHEIYSTKLLDALRLVRAWGVGVAPSPSPAREVRDAADRALAVAARGRSRWSRAILASRRAHRVHRVRLHAPAPAPSPPRLASPDASSSSGSSTSAREPALARKAKVLGRLVPGCRKLPFPALLSEASDYIAALEMQVRAMAALAQALSAVSPPP